MADSLEIADGVIAPALDDGRVGTPVAARLLIHTPADHGQLEPLLARGIEVACRWLRSEPERLLVRGGAETGHIAAQVLCAGGRSLLASVALCGALKPRLEAVIVGNRGVAHWQPDPDALPGRAAGGDGSSKFSPRATRLLAWIRRSSAVGRFDPPPETAEVDKPPAPRQRPRPAAAKPGKPAASGDARPLAPPYGVLLVAGNQSHQEMYGPAFAKDSRCRMVGLVDAADVPARRRELNAEMARSLEIPLLADLDEALWRPDVHVVSICADPQRRAPLIIRAAEAGKHLYLDKPLSATIEEADQIATAVRRSGVRNQMFSQVHNNATTRAREIVQSGALGTLLAVHCDTFFAKGPAGHAALDRPRRETARPRMFEAPEAKRELHNVGVYPLVMLHWLLGREAQRITAVTANYFFAEHQRLDMEDFAQLTVEFDGGVVATVSAGRTGWRSHPAGGHNRTYLVGTAGTLAIDWHLPRLEVWADEDGWPHPARHPEDPMGFWITTVSGAGVPPKRSWYAPSEATSDVRYFLDCLEHGRASDVTAEDGAAVMEMLIAAYESAATGQCVELPITRS